MLAVRLQPPPTDNPRRGRSRQVSHAALARKASVERKLPLNIHNSSHASPITKPSFMPPMDNSPPSLSSSASLSPDYYDSPPSPPRSLEDQVHVAYALDDIHLAKVLLLRLKGIHVSSPDDPRIAAVRDEDFDFCFMPHGRLMDAEEELVFEQKERENKRLEAERRAEVRRDQHLRACERLWENGKRQLREMRELAARMREEEKRRAEEQRKRVAAEQARKSRRVSPRPRVSHRSVVSYKLTPSTARRGDDPFLYDFMPVRPLPTRALVPIQPKRKSMSPFSRPPLFDDTRTVPFSEVLTSMRGPLFPPIPTERRTISPLSTTSGSRSKDRRKTELLDALLKVVDQDVEDRRRTKGKAPERLLPKRRNSAISTVSCAACTCPESCSSDASSSSSSSTTSSSSRKSWLSFSSASSSSASTAPTTPSTSPPTTSWFSKSPTRTTVEPTQRKTVGWFSSTPCQTTTPHRHSCQHQRTPVAPSDSPLSLNIVPASSLVYTKTKSDTHGSPAPRPPPPADPSGLLARLLDIARYLSAVTVSGDRGRICDVTRYSRPPTSASAFGSRAHVADVRLFLSPPPHTSHSRISHDPQPIPLRPMRSQIPPPAVSSEDGDSDEGNYDAHSPSTPLPSPLPYKLHFKPLPVPCRSPFRLAAAGQQAGPGMRVRVVENPLHLKVKALANARTARGAVHLHLGFGYGYGFGAGMGLTEGTLGSGREKVLQLVHEGAQGSRLSVAPDVVVHGSSASLWETQRTGRGAEWW